MNLKVTSRTLSIAGRQIRFDLPADPEELLQQALDGEAKGSCDWDPYWGLLWAAAPKTAEVILQHRWQKPLRSMELGCGVGVAGIAALMAGLDVTFADHAADAVRMAQSNAAQNGFSDAAGLMFDWQHPPAEQFDFIFGSDILYDSAGHEPLLQTLKSMLSPGGEVWIGDAGRINAPRFVEQAIKAGWSVELRNAMNEPIKKPGHLEYRLIVLSLKA